MERIKVFVMDLETKTVHRTMMVSSECVLKTGLNVEISVRVFKTLFIRNSPVYRTIALVLQKFMSYFSCIKASFVC